MDSTPTYYSDISSKAIEIKAKYNLSDTQTLLYNHICRGDFYLRNEDGQKFYDIKNKGFGWYGDRDWVKKQFKKLIKEGLVSFQSLHDCRDKKYTSWYFYDSRYNITDLVDAGCYVKTHKLALIKHYLNLDDGFSKNKKYNGFELIHNDLGYSFIYKGEGNIYSWDNNGEGNKSDLTWLYGQPNYSTPRYEKTFEDMLHNLYSFLINDDYKFKTYVPNYTNKRIFNIPK